VSTDLLLMYFLCLFICSLPSDSASQDGVAAQLSTGLPAAGPVQPADMQQSAASVVQTSSFQRHSSVASKTAPLWPHIQSVADDGRRTVAKVPPPDSDDDDEVEVIQAFCGRPTRSGRIPRPAVRSSEDHAELMAVVAEPMKLCASDNTVDNHTDSRLTARENLLTTAALNQSKPVVTLQSQARHTTSLISSSAISSHRMVLNQSKPVVTLQSQARHTTSLISSSAISSHHASHTTVLNQSKPVVTLQSQARHVTSLNSSPAISSQHASHTHGPVASAVPALVASAVPALVSSAVPAPVASAVPATQQIDPSRLPPGYFVVVEVPPSSSCSSDVSGGQQQALYHIFAIDQGVTESTALPAVDDVSRAAYQQPGTAGHQSAVCSQHGTVSHAGHVSNGGTVESTVCGPTPHTAAPQQTDRQVLSSSSHDMTQFCHELSGLTNCQLTAVQQGDGTVVIQTTPSTIHLAQPRLPPAQLVPRPAPTQLVPRQTSTTLLPCFSSAQVLTQQMLTCGEDIVLDAHCDNSGDEGDVQYVDIVVEDCDS